MQVVIYVALGGIVAAAGIAVLWTLFFTSVLPWSGHSMFTPYLFPSRRVARQSIGLAKGH